MSIHKARDGVWVVRWRESGRNRNTRVHGAYELAKKIETAINTVTTHWAHLGAKKDV